MAQARANSDYAGAGMRARGSAGPWLVLACALPVCLPIGLLRWTRSRRIGFRLATGVTSVRAWVCQHPPPLTGQWSSGASAAAEAPTYSPAMLFWLLAIRSGCLAELASGGHGIVNTAAVVGSLLLARRRGGDGLLLATAILIRSCSRRFRARPTRTSGTPRSRWRADPARVPRLVARLRRRLAPPGDGRRGELHRAGHLTFVAPRSGWRPWGWSALAPGLGRLGPSYARWVVVTLAWERCAGWRRRSISWCTARQRRPDRPLRRGRRARLGFEPGGARSCTRSAWCLVALPATRRE